MGDRGSVWQEVRPGSSSDPDASQAAASLSAYFEFERARASRRLLCRIAVAIAVASAVFQAITRVLPGLVLFFGLIALGTLALIATVVEWRAEKQLSTVTAGCRAAPQIQRRNRSRAR